MTGKELFFEIGFIDDDIIIEADTEKLFRKPVYAKALRIISAAAVFVVIAAAALFQIRNGGEDVYKPAETLPELTSALSTSAEADPSAASAETEPAVNGLSAGSANESATAAVISSGAETQLPADDEVSSDYRENAVTAVITSSAETESTVNELNAEDEAENAGLDGDSAGFAAGVSDYPLKLYYDGAIYTFEYLRDNPGTVKKIPREVTDEYLMSIMKYFEENFLLINMREDIMAIEEAMPGEPEDGGLTYREIFEIDEADEILSGVMAGDGYKSMSYNERVDFIYEVLIDLAENGSGIFAYPLINKQSVVLSGDMYSFEYSCGAVGGVKLTDWDEDKNGSENYYARYFRTNGYSRTAEYPKITVVSSLDDLNGYYEEYKDIYEFQSRSFGSEDSFSEAIGKYSDDYFLDNYLVIVLLEEGSGSVRHSVESVSESGEIVIKRLIPEIGTMDIAEWHIIIELRGNETIPQNWSVLYLTENV